MLLECSWFPMLWQGVFWTPGVGPVDPLRGVRCWVTTRSHGPSIMVCSLGSPQGKGVSCSAAPVHGESSSLSSRLPLSASHHPLSAESWEQPGQAPSHPSGGAGWASMYIHAQGCHDKFLQMEWLTITEMYSRCSGGWKSDITVSPRWFLPLLLMENPLPASLPASCGALVPPELVDALSPVPAAELASPSSPSLSSSVSSEDTLTGFRDHPNPGWFKPHVNYICKDPYS